MGRWLAKNDYKLTKEVIYCGHCGNRTIMHLVSQQDYIKELNDEYYSQMKYTWKVLICPTCEEVNILESGLWSEAESGYVGSESDGEETFDPPQPNLKYLHPVEKVFNDTSIDTQRIRATYQEAARACKAKLYTQSVITCRRAVELLCKLYEIEEKNLALSIEKMRDCEIIDKMLYDWADALRDFGNAAVHTGQNFSKRDTEDIINFTYSLIEYCIDFQWKFTSLLKRRKLTLSTKTDIDRQVDILLNALNDPNKFFRYYAAENLTKMGVKDDKIVTVLIDLIRVEKGDFLKAVDECLAKTGQIAVPDIVKLIKDSSVSKENKISAIKVLGKMGLKTNYAAVELISLLEDSTIDDKIKIAITSSLKQMGTLAKNTFINYCKERT